MRLSGFALAAVLLSASHLLAQHSSGGGSSGGGSSGGGSHSSSSGGSGYSGGGSSGGHSSGGYSSGSSHSSGAGHVSGASSSSHGSASHGTNDHGSKLTNPTRNRAPGNAGGLRSIHEPAPARTARPEKRGFFSVLFHPFRKGPAKPEPKPALYFPKPICPHGRCAPTCPVGQARRGGACTTPVIPTCVPGQFWSGEECNYTRDHQCRWGEMWNGNACTIGAHVLDNCFALRNTLQRQIQRVQAAESIRRSACANGAGPECSEATSSWQSEENLRQSLLARYQQCQVQSTASYSGRYDPHGYDSVLRLDSLRFSADF